MKAILTQDEHGALSAEWQGEYKPREGGGFILDVAAVDGYELATVSKMRTALETERNNAATSSKELNALKEKFGDLDPEAAKAAMEKVAEMGDWDPERKNAEAKAEYERQIQEKYENQQKQLIAGHKKETEGHTQKLSARTKQLHKALITSSATKAITDNGGAVDLLIHAVEGQSRLAENDDGTFRTEILNSEGAPRMSTNGTNTTPMTHDELVKEMKNDPRFARAFDSSGASGTGASGSSSASSGSAGGAIRLTEEQARDPAKYRAAKAQAEKAGVQLEIT
jgi:hypothetical protein